MHKTLVAGAAILALSISAAAAQTSQPSTVYFGLNESTLDTDGLQTVANVANSYQRDRNANVMVTGYTDLTGSASYNQRLSEERAEAVRSELVRLGVPESSITVSAEGENDPAVPTGEGVPESQNRRVEIAVESMAPAPMAETAEPVEAPAPVTAAAEPTPVAEAPARGLFSLGAFYGYNMLDQGDNDGLDSSDNSDKTSHLAGANLSFDYALLDWLSLGLEQAVFYNFGTDDDGLGGRSAAGFDFVLARGSIVPYIGANIGYLYGKGIEDDAFAGPEVGIALGFLNAKVAYDMPFNRSADEGIIATTFGLGIRF